MIVEATELFHFFTTPLHETLNMEDLIIIKRTRTYLNLGLLLFGVSVRCAYVGFTFAWLVSTFATFIRHCTAFSAQLSISEVAE
jgi:hypothetical protein